MDCDTYFPANVSMGAIIGPTNPQIIICGNMLRSKANVQSPKILMSNLAHIYIYAANLLDISQISQALKVQCRNSMDRPDLAVRSISEKSNHCTHPPCTCGAMNLIRFSPPRIRDAHSLLHRASRLITLPFPLYNDG